MDNITTTISFSVFSNKGVYALLLGSGISTNSGIPTGWDVVIDLITKLAKINNDNCEPNPEEWFTSKYGEEPNYSRILSKLAKPSSERVKLLEPYFKQTEEDIEQKTKEPTIAHRKIATLIKKGYIKVIITTNFDRLLEKALQAEGIEPTVIRHPNDIDGAMPIVHSEITIIKVNGDYLDTRFLNTEEELEKYDKKLNDYILSIINDFGIISCGWSAKWDKGLKDVIIQSENFRFYSYWTYKGNCEEELKEIAKRRKGENVEIKDSDSFFNEVTEKIFALESINDNHPLNSEIAVARLKKYIVKDEYKILLHDLINNQLNATILKLRIKDDASLHTTKENIIPLFDHYINCFEDLIPLIINGVYWAKEEQHYLFINILSRISEPPKTANGSYREDTLKLLNFPSLLALYTIGLSALKNNNFNLLNSCFNLKISDNDNDYSEKIAVIEKVNSNIVDNRIINNILSQKNKTALSTYLCKVLKSYFVKSFYNEKEFDDYFDLFEYLISLNYIYIVGNKWGHYWAPWGQFQYRKILAMRGHEYILNDFLAEAEKLQSEWFPLKAGMFGGKYENYIDVKNKLEEFLKGIHLG